MTRPSSPKSTPATSAPAERRSLRLAYSETRRSLEPCAPPATGSEKAYNPRAGLLHAHDYPPITFMRRYFDKYRGLRVTAAQLGAASTDRAWGR